MTDVVCDHISKTTAVPHAQVCEECGAPSSLRLCTECGHVGCCESQQSHGRSHALGAGHPVIKSLPLGNGSFTWCYTCDRYV